MPIIKITSGGKVITKDGKPSCTCCGGPDPDCCLYPADKLGVDYDAADLPDSVYVYWRDIAADEVLFDGVLTKSGSGYVSGTTTLNNTENPLVWRLSDSDEARIYFGAPCLILNDGSGTEFSEVKIEDQFAESYTLTSEHGSVVVDRVSLCRWEKTVEIGSPDLDGSLEYYPTNPTEGQPSPAWVALMNDGQEMKPAGGEKTTPNLSSPVGTYSGYFIPDVTVS